MPRRSNIKHRLNIIGEWVFRCIVSLLFPQVLLLLQGAEPPTLCSRQKLSRPYSEVTVMTLLTSMADKELVHMIAWAKKLPGTAPVNPFNYIKTITKKTLILTV